jgi:hypothetical protein
MASFLCVVQRLMTLVMVLIINIDKSKVLPPGDRQKSTSSRGTSVTNKPCGLQPNTEFPTNSAQFVGHECSDPQEGYIFDVFDEEDDENADDSQPTLHRNKSPVACRNLSPESKVP